MAMNSTSRGASLPPTASERRPAEFPEKFCAEPIEPDAFAAPDGMLLNSSGCTPGNDTTAA